MILPVIMAGGSGSRLWPLSRTLYPKQFLSLVSNLTMLQDTVVRLNNIKHQSPLFICNEAHRFIVAEQLRQENIKHSGIILEPVGRNTAPAIALAALQAIHNGDDPILLVLAADHAIQNEKAFTESVSSAIAHAANDKLVTFGIVPDRPETGYGYIRRGLPIDNAFTVSSFVEKPDIVSAQNYLDTGEYYWNSGMFMFKASRYLKELECHSPEIYQACSRSIEGINKDLDFIRLDSDAFHICPDDSIDYAVMEKTADAVVVPMDACWSDVGSWSALWDIAVKDQCGNAIRGDVLTEKTSGSYIYSQNKLVATVGIDNLIVVETKDAVLVANKDSVQDVKSIVEKLKRSERCEYLQHREVFRPWGSHDQIVEGERYHVKRVVVKPGERTATQLHYHRAEHWVVVSGTAKVYKGDEVHIVSENESIYIPIGISHAIENPGKVMLEIIEVRSGSYLGEDDVLRVGTASVGY